MPFKHRALPPLINGSDIITCKVGFSEAHAVIYFSLCQP